MRWEERGKKGADGFSLRVFIDLSSIRDALNTEALISESSSCKHLRNLSTRLRILPRGVRPWIRLMSCVLIIYRLRDSPVSVTWLSRCQNRTEHCDSEKGLMICKPPPPTHTQRKPRPALHKKSDLLIPVRFVYGLETSLWATQELGQRRFVHEQSELIPGSAHIRSPRPHSGTFT